MNFTDDIMAFVPANEQERADREIMLEFANTHSDCLLRSNKIGHFTTSAWIVDRSHTKVLFCYHNIYDSWSWVGGHADGESDLSAVALREAWEETGIKSGRLCKDGIISLETLTVDGHEKHGEYVPCHLHFNLTYLIEADESETLTVNREENSGVKWFTFDEAVKASTEPWIVERIYKKIISKEQ